MSPSSMFVGTIKGFRTGASFEVDPDKHEKDKGIDYIKQISTVAKQNK